jgi:hypothetical protein
MNKKTKRTKQRSNKTRNKKYIGGEGDSITHTTEGVNPNKGESITNNQTTPSTMKGFEKSKGVLDIVGDRFKDWGHTSAEYLKNVALKSAGLKEIETPTDTKVEETTSDIANKASELANTATELASKVSASIIGSVNTALNNPDVKGSVAETAKETAKIATEVLETFNNELSTPKMKEEVKEALDNAGEYAVIAGEALKEPLEVAGERINEAVVLGASGLASGAVKVGTDAAAAIPGLGAVVEVGKIINDSSAAIGDVVEAGTDIASTVSELVVNTNDNITEGIEKLNAIKKEGNNIAERTGASVESFNDSSKNRNLSSVVPSILKTENKIGGRKTRRKLLKRKGKSKRVRFAI